MTAIQYQMSLFLRLPILDVLLLMLSLQASIRFTRCWQYVDLQKQPCDFLRTTESILLVKLHQASSTFSIHLVHV